MVHLILSIGCSTAILFLFKHMEQRQIPLLYTIIVNYAVAAGLGVLLDPGIFNPRHLAQAAWLPFSVFIGALLITMFFLIGRSTQRAGIAVTTIAGKMSVVLPMLFSVVYYSEPLGPLKLMGMAMALTALFLSIYKGAGAPDKGTLGLPLLLFAGMGSLDSLIKLVQQDFIAPGETAAFTGICFFFALVFGLGVCGMKRLSPAPFTRTDVAGFGLVLGSVNFGSIYFLIQALDTKTLDSSILFAVNSIGVVCAAILMAALCFRERLTPLNWTGIALALAAIATFTAAQPLP